MVFCNNVPAERVMAIFIGSIPSTIGTLHNLTSLNLYGNSLIGLLLLFHSQAKLSYAVIFIGTLPSSLSLLTNLQFLDLDTNKLIGNINCKRNIKYFIVVFLIGTIPTSFAALTGLTTLRLHENCLTGNIYLLYHLAIIYNSIVIRHNTNFNFWVDKIGRVLYLFKLS